MAWTTVPPAQPARGEPTRFQVEMEMGIAITVCYLAKLLLDFVPSRTRTVLIVALFVAAVPVAKSNRRMARNLDSPMDMAQTSEYKMSQAFARLRPKSRVFATGNISYWMNLWTETPQVDGCCDQGVPDMEHRISNWAVYTGQNSGTRDAELSILWLRAWGATAIGVGGPRGTEPFKPMWHPFKFEGVLPVLWREGDDVIYDIPSRHDSLAHVISLEALIARSPENGLDTAALERFVSALENPAAPEARFEWTSQHSARVSTSMQPGQLLSIQVTHDPGWRAQIGMSRRPVLRDGLGLMAIDTGCSGPCEVDLSYDGGAEGAYMAALQLVGLSLAVAAPFLLARLGAKRAAVA